MAVAEIARRLGDRFALLAGHDRSAPDRHQTLEAVIAWSWNLLGPDDQVALRTLAVFPDGFSARRAPRRCSNAIRCRSLMELVDQSLLVVREGEDVRYRFLETVREYGLKQLDLAGETGAVRARLQRLGRGLRPRTGRAALQCRPDRGHGRHPGRGRQHRRGDAVRRSTSRTPRASCLSWECSPASGRSRATTSACRRSPGRCSTWSPARPRPRRSTRPSCAVCWPR